MLAFDNNGTIYALLEGRQLVRIEPKVGVTFVGFPVSDKVKLLDSRSLYLKIEDDLLKIGDNLSEYFTPLTHVYWGFRDNVKGEQCSPRN